MDLQKRWQKWIVSTTPFLRLVVNRYFGIYVTGSCYSVITIQGMGLSPLRLRKYSPSGRGYLRYFHGWIRQKSRKRFSNGNAGNGRLLLLLEPAFLLKRVAVLANLYSRTDPRDKTSPSQHEKSHHLRAFSLPWIFAFCAFFCASVKQYHC